MLEHTAKHVAEQLVEELPPMTEQKEQLLENAEDPIATKLLDLAELVDQIPAPEQAEQFLPLIERIFREEAIYAEVTRYEDLDENLAEEAEERRQKAGDWLNSLELTIRSW
jgi:hypothetical protein